MREILFRGKRIDNGEWVYGYLFRIWERVYILWGTFNGVPNMVEVDFSTICECTELTDKNGLKIYEGDLLLQKTTKKFNKVNPNLWERKYQVVFDYHKVRSGWADGSAYGWCLKEIPTNVCKAIGNLENDNKNGYYPYEIIGNIFDNPNLIDL